MRSPLNRYVPLILAALMLAGCGTPNPRPPAELASIQTTLAVTQAWRQDAGAGVDDNYLKLYPVLTADTAYIVDAKGRVSALDAETGERRWTVSLEVPVSAGLNGDDELLVLGTEDGLAIALRAADGTELWRRQLRSTVAAFSEVDLNVVVARTLDGKLYGLDSESGEVLWQYGRTPPALTLQGTSLPRLESGKVVVGFDDGTLVALSPVRGQPDWEVPVAVPSGRSELERLADIDGRFESIGGIVYIGAYRGQLAAVGLGEGRVLQAIDFSTDAGLTVDADQLYAVDEDSVLWALDRSTFKTLWKQEGLRFRRLTAPAVVGDYVVVGDLDGYVHWFAQGDGHFVARTRVGDDPILTPPLAAGQAVYVYDTAGRLTKLILPDGG